MEGWLELFHSGNHADLIVAGTSWWQLWGCSGLTLQGNVFFCDQDRPLHRRLSRAASGCHGKLGIESLCGPLRADSPYAMLIGHLPQSIS